MRGNDGAPARTHENAPSGKPDLAKPRAYRTATSYGSRATERETRREEARALGRRDSFHRTHGDGTRVPSRGRGYVDGAAVHARAHVGHDDVGLDERHRAEH